MHLLPHTRVQVRTLKLKPDEKKALRSGCVCTWRMPSFLARGLCGPDVPSVPPSIEGGVPGGSRGESEGVWSNGVGERGWLGEGSVGWLVTAGW